MSNNLDVTFALTKREKKMLRRFRLRKTVSVSERKFAAVASSGLFYPVLKPGQYWWGSKTGEPVKVRLTPDGERMLVRLRSDRMENIRAWISLAIKVLPLVSSIIALIIGWVMR